MERINLDMFSRTDVTKLLWWRQVLASNHRYSHAINRSTEQDPTALLVEGFEVVGVEIGDRYRTITWRTATGIVSAGWSPTESLASVEACAATREEAKQLVELVVEKLPDVEGVRNRAVPFGFWYYAEHGPRYRNRRLIVPTWDEIERNYSASIRGDLSNLMAGPPPSGGNLVLFQGPAGTGKTWAIRSLVLSWVKFCRAHYVMDPERFFGQADYMAEVLLGDGDEVTDEDEAGRYKGWKLLIVEDCGELLSIDAKERTGQGLGRLLNLTEGILGQGLHLTVLITTNEDVGVLNTAVLRSGRCASRIQFPKLTADECNIWLGCRGVKLERMSYSDRTLAELYAIVEGRSKKSSEKVVGFK